MNGAEIARKSNLARTSIYEYFASADDIFAEVLIGELIDFREEIALAISKSVDPSQFITDWISLNLQYIESGRHLVAKRLMPMALDSALRDEIKAAHKSLFEVFEQGCSQYEIKVSEIQLSFINSIIETATKKIESGHSPTTVRQETTKFILKSFSL